MSLGNVINVGYEKVLLMQNSLNTPPPRRCLPLQRL